MAILMKNIHKNFKNIQALKNISLRFEKNQITGLIGFNGSGKTTTFNIITNIIDSYKGNVFIEKNGSERPITRKDRWMMSYLAAGTEPQNSEKVMTHINFMGGLFGLSKKEIKTKIKDLVEILGFSRNLNAKTKSLSKGNQQKIKIICAFLNPYAEYIFLDEPFDGLDPIVVEKLRKYIMTHKQNKCIVITSHRMEVVDQMCDSFYILKEGNLVEHKTLEEQTQNLLLVTNIGTSIDKIRDFKEIISVMKTEKEIHIEVASKHHYKVLANKLMLQEDCEFVSLKEKKLTDSVFERYANE